MVKFRSLNKGTNELGQSVKIQTNGMKVQTMRLKIVCVCVCVYIYIYMYGEI